MGRHSVYRLFESALPTEICDLVVAQGSALSARQASLLPDGGKEYLDENIRQTKIAFWEASHWVSGLLMHYVMQANEELWNYRLSCSQGVQFGEYGVGGRYDWHKDEFDQPFGDESPPCWQGLSRKLSAVAMLSDPNDYAGGELRLKNTYAQELNDPEETARFRRRGSVVVFPSYILHTVTPVTSGRRFSIVSWIVGPPFA